LLLFNTSLVFAQPDTYQTLIKQLHVPEGFSLSVYADNLPGARSLTLADNGVVFVGTGQEGQVYAIQDTNADGKADKRHIIATKLMMPNGVAYQEKPYL